MTIGIAVSGPMAGLAAFRALRAVEAVGRGAIGGFVSLVAVGADGNMVAAETQRGGCSALFGGGDPPRHIAKAGLAALMSSGPDRPEPLGQFTPADPSAGLVTGHRLPNMAGRGGVVPADAALRLLREGTDPQQAVQAALAADPETDAGLIVMDLGGRIALGNSAAVARRDDLGEALVSDEASGLQIGILHNSIFPHRALPMLAVSAAIDSVAPPDRCDGQAALLGVPLLRGPERSLALDADAAVESVTVTCDRWLGPGWEGSVVWRGDPVRQNGVEVGRVTREVYCVVRDGRIVGSRGGDRAGWRSNAGQEAAWNPARP